LGFEVDATGTSFLYPPNKFFNTPIFSPLLTVTGDRTAPNCAAAKWDDEGVEVRPHTLIREGHVVDYCHSRQTAAMLRSKHGVASQANGTATAPDAGDPILVRSPHLNMTAASAPATLEDLCRNVENGVLVLDRYDISVDQQLSSGSLIHNPGLPDGLVLKIEKGKIVHRLHGTGLQFRTSSLLNKQVVAVGDRTTLGTSVPNMGKGMPWKYVLQGATAPAVLFKDVDVISVQGNVS
jgi:predicted Zn-dependent protease